MKKPTIENFPILISVQSILKNCRPNINQNSITLLLGIALSIKHQDHHAVRQIYIDSCAKRSSVLDKDLINNLITDRTLMSLKEKIKGRDEKYFINWYNSAVIDIIKGEVTEIATIYYGQYGKLSILSSELDKIVKDSFDVYFTNFPFELPPALKPETIAKFPALSQTVIYKSRFDFTDDKLRPKILEIAGMKGFLKPSTFLNELLKDVNNFNDFEFKCNFYITIHHLCKENSSAFWSKSHKEDITQWLKNAPICTNIFEKTWDVDVVKKTSLVKSSLNLPINQIALMHFYNGILITRENANEKAAEYGWISKESGEGLFQDYIYYTKPSNRKEKPTPCTKRKLKNKIMLFEKVAELITGKGKDRANDEIKILKIVFADEYE